MTTDMRCPSPYPLKVNEAPLAPLLPSINAVSITEASWQTVCRRADIPTGGRLQRYAFLLYDALPAEEQRPSGTPSPQQAGKQAKSTGEKRGALRLRYNCGILCHLLDGMCGSAQPQQKCLK